MQQGTDSRFNPSRATLVLSLAKVTLPLMMICSVIAPPAQAEIILNPGFETTHHDLMPSGAPTSTHDYRGIPDDWSWRQQGATNGHALRSDSIPAWTSEGQWSLYLFAATPANQPGDFVEYYQPIDFTHLTNVLFDVKLRGGLHTNSYLAAGDRLLWQANDEGILLGVDIDVTHITGVQELRLGVEVFEPVATGADGWTWFDNLRTVPEPATLFLLALGAIAVRKRQ